MTTGRTGARWGDELLFDSAPCGYVITRLDGIILDVNDTFLRWTGFRRDELLNQARLTDLLTPGARAIHEIYHLPGLEKAQELHDSPSEFACPGGDRLPVMISSAMRFAESQSREVIIHAISDARARREYERDLRRARDEERTARTQAEGLAAALARQARHEAAIAELGRLALARTDTAALVSHTAELIREAVQTDGVSVLNDAAAPPPGATLLTVDDAEERDYFIAIAAPVLREDVAFLKSICQLLKIAIQRRQNDDRHRHLALHDPLTGLANRSLLIDRLAQALARRPRDNRPFCVMMIDVDGFKAVNDTHGHGVGDELLCHVAVRVAGVLRAADTVARIGGDEFAAVCGELAGTGHAEDLAERVAAAIAEPVTIDGRQIVVHATVGRVMAAEHATPEELLDAADADMYRRKRQPQR